MSGQLHAPDSLTPTPIEKGAEWA